MEVKELLEKVLAKDIPKHIVFIENCRTLLKEYLKSFSKTLNKKIIHTFTEKDTKAINGRFDRDDILIVAHGLSKFDNWAASQSANIVFVQLEDIPTSLPKVIFKNPTRAQSLLYLPQWLIERGFFNVKEERGAKTKVPTLSRDRMEKLLDYFDNDLDMVICEFEKLISLENHTLNSSFDALFDCLPLKDKRLKSLPWYSGGAVDTAQVLYNTYMKKLKASGEMNVSLDKQKFYAQLIKEAVFVETNILSGTFGDYAVDYFRLIESMTPDDMKVCWHPPVSQEEIGEEWSY